jgi:hypothetical protein
MERTKTVIPVSKEAVEHGFKLGAKVYTDKLNFPGKFFLGGASELQADIYGFIAETAVCEYFKQPFPAFTPQTNDEFDVMIAGKRVDVKKVGFSSYTKQPKITLNKKQYARKRNLIDVFLFCTFEGGFEQKIVGKEGYQVFVPMPGMSTIWLIGWIESKKVSEVARTYFWKDRDGKPRDEAWLLRLNQLKEVKELIP